MVEATNDDEQLYMEELTDLTIDTKFALGTGTWG
jgi:hypothetical protein